MKTETMTMLEKMNKAQKALEAARNRAAAAAECFITGKIQLVELSSFVGQMQAAEKMFNQAAREYRASYQPEAT
jgi:hypothetical protein